MSTRGSSQMLIASTFRVSARQTGSHIHKPHTQYSTPIAVVWVVPSSRFDDCDIRGSAPLILPLFAQSAQLLDGSTITVIYRYLQYMLRVAFQTAYEVKHKRIKYIYLWLYQYHSSNQF
jgi:hypothetical protein